MSYLLDTNAINKALDQEIEPSTFARAGVLFVTHVQVDEIRRTRKPERLEALLAVLQEIQPRRLSTSVAVWDHSAWGEAELGTEQASDIYQRLVTALDARNRGKANNIEDALIGVTAIIQHLTLVSDDAHLVAVVHELGGEAISFEMLLHRATK